MNMLAVFCLILPALAGAAEPQVPPALESSGKQVSDLANNFKASMAARPQRVPVPSTPPRYMIVSTAYFDELGYEPGGEAFRYGVYAFDPVGWMVASGRAQDGAARYPPLAALTNGPVRAQSFIARTALELESLFAKEYSPEETRIVFWLTHGFGTDSVTWFDGIYDNAGAEQRFRELTRLRPQTRLIIEHCFMDQRGAIKPAQLYVQDIWPILMQDPDLLHPEPAQIPRRDSSGGKIILGDGSVISIPGHK